MSLRHTVSDATKDAISFDTLLAQATAVINQYGGATWSDQAEHDPGVTVLQALCYNTADLAYRHVLPLEDLLTAEGAETLFPVGAGPHRALTCSPVTVDDYRRVLLDIYGGLWKPATKGFRFRNATVVPVDEQSARIYSYFYDRSVGNFSFKEVVGTAPMVLLGDYDVTLEKSQYGTGASLEAMVQKALGQCQNLGERLRIAAIFDRQIKQLCVEIEIADDTEDLLPLALDLYRVTLDHLMPEAARQTTKGADEESDGPCLSYGPILNLPPERSTTVTLNLTPLVSRYLALRDVKKVKRVSSSGKGINWNLSVGLDSEIWGIYSANGNYFASDVSFTKLGQRVEVDTDRLLAALISEGIWGAPNAALTIPKELPAGRRRAAPYHPASLRLPACYGQQELEPDALQRQLHQFLLGFEQELANGCDQLARLPQLLSFDRDAGASGEAGNIFGARWPFVDADERHDPAQSVHAAYRQELEDLNAGAALDYEKELDLIDHLLGYFGAERAPRALLPGTPEDFLAVQRGYLRQIVELGYDRARIQVDQVSAVQRRIAARLGWAKTLFSAAPDLGNLPFYVVERRAFLPERPDSELDGNQTFSAFTYQAAADGKPEHIVLEGENVAKLIQSQMIELVILGESSLEAVIGPNIVRLDGEAVVLHLDDNDRLARNLERLTASNGENNLRWRNAAFWLHDMEHDLLQLEAVDGKDAQRTISTTHWPADLRPGDQLQLTRSLAATRSGRSSSRAAGDGLTLEVVAVDPERGTLIAQATDAAQWAGVTEPSRWTWHIDRTRQDPPLDRFSFVVSLAFNRSILADVADPVATAQWIETVVREEMPAHILPMVHWLLPDQYQEFRQVYARWHNGGQPLGDLSYRLVEMLGIGQLRADGPSGIGERRIASSAEQALATSPWDQNYIDENQLLHVPPSGRKTPGE